MTPRERQVLHLISHGLNCQQIAARLGISPLTVRKHRSHIMAKAGLTQSAQLRALASHAFRQTGQRTAR